MQIYKYFMKSVLIFCLKEVFFFYNYFLCSYCVSNCPVKDIVTYVFCPACFLQV